MGKGNFSIPMGLIIQAISIRAMLMAKEGLSVLRGGCTRVNSKINRLKERAFSSTKYSGTSSKDSGRVISPMAMGGKSGKQRESHTKDIFSMEENMVRANTSATSTLMRAFSMMMYLTPMAS